MKFVYTLLIIVIFAVVEVNAAVGCSTYNGLYPNSNGTTNPSTGNIYYKSTDYIVFRTWDNDPRCGIRDNKITTYSPYTQCDVVGVMNWGMLVVYNPADNNCIEVPIDDYVLPALLLIGGVAYFRIRNTRLMPLELT